MSKKRIAAIVGIALIVIMAIVTLLVAIFDKSGTLFRSCLILTIALPIAVWFFVWALGAMTGKHTMASIDFLNGEKTEEESNANAEKEE